MTRAPGSNQPRKGSGGRIGRSRLSALASGALVIGLATASVASPATAQEYEDVSGPGPEHAVLTQLAGRWTVSMGGSEVGNAVAGLRLDGRFLEIEMMLRAGPVSHALYTFGFDRRHNEYIVTLMDNTGTYSVTARGQREGSRIAMYGVDDDPVMTSMGLTKEFVIVLDVRSADDVSVETLFIDTRTSARTEMPFVSYRLSR